MRLANTAAPIDSGQRPPIDYAAPAGNDSPNDAIAAHPPLVIRFVAPPRAYRSEPEPIRVARRYLTWFLRPFDQRIQPRFGGLHATFVRDPSGFPSGGAMTPDPRAQRTVFRAIPEPWDAGTEES